MVITNGANGEAKIYDVPENPDVTSMGNLDWPPKEATDHRRKFFYRTAITNHEHLMKFKATYDSELNFNGTTRMTGRVIVSQDEFSEFIQVFGADIETIIPLAETEALEDCLMVYIGRNLPERLSPPFVLERQIQQATEIFKTPGKPKKQPLNFTFRPITDEERTTMVSDFLELYKPFHWEENDVLKILNNKNSIIMVAISSQGTLAGSVLGEIATIEIDRDGKKIPFTMAEITEAATKKEFQGMGLYGVLSDTLLFWLDDLANPNLVFGEVNLDAPGALTTAARQGRTPALHTAELYNMREAWRLNQHVAISEGSPEEETPGYNNLMPAWLTRKQLKEFVTI